MPEKPYSLLTLSVLSLLIYGLSIVLVKVGFISRDSQRKFWNILLLLAILAAGGFGIFLAVIVNFKISMPRVDSLLVWHVDFGIVLCTIAVFHFSNHIKYYRDIFRKPAIVAKEPVFKEREVPQRDRHGINLNLFPFSLGFTSMATQLILLREFLFVFNGNELSIGIVLANWMLLTGAGAYINAKTISHGRMKQIAAGLFLLPFIPVITLFLLYWLRNIVLPVGIQPGILSIFTVSAVLLAPFCLFSGWLFSLISVSISDSRKKNEVSGTYSRETAGSIIAGILCGMVLVFLFEPFQNLAIILILNSSILFFITRQEIFVSRKKFIFYVVSAISSGILLFNANPDRISLQFLFPEQKIITFKDTPYGKLVVSEKDGQLNFYDNNTLLFTTNNIIANEESVHYTLLQRPMTGNVLLIGGGISGVAEESLKYPIKRLDCAEINPLIVKFGKQFNRLPADPRFKIYKGDPRILISKTEGIKSQLLSGVERDNRKTDSLSYDAIIINVPEPSTLQINRLYTLEFLKKCKTLLVSGGIVSLSLMSTADYVGKEALKIQSTMYQTLKAVFRNVAVIPGEKNHLLASDGSLTAAVSTLPVKRGISTEYVNEYYLDDVSLQERSAGIMQRISVDAPLNLDFRPVACYMQLRYWLSYQGIFSLMALGIVIITVLFIAGIKATGTTVALFSAGFSSFSLQMILILTFQVIYGYIYLAVGGFFTLFMAGLALGVLLAKRFPGKSTYKSLITLQAISGGILLLSLGAIVLLTRFTLHTFVIYAAFSIIILGMAATTGAQFHIVSVLKPGKIIKIAAKSYSADLAGSATGALLVNAWLIPYFGLAISLPVVAGINTLALLLMMVKKHT